MKLAPRRFAADSARVRVVLEIRVDLRLRDLRADLLGRERPQPSERSRVVDRLEVRAVVLLLRR